MVDKSKMHAVLAAAAVALLVIVIAFTAGKTKPEKGAGGEPCGDYPPCLPGKSCVVGAGGSKECQPVCGNSGAACALGQKCIKGECKDVCGDLDYACSPADACVDGKCVERCAGGEPCPAGQRCKNGEKCVEACDGVWCPDNAACVGGKCKAVCDNDGVGSPCPEGYECYAPEPVGVADPYCKQLCGASKQMCPPGESCVDGESCKKDCGYAGHHCAHGQTCYNGACHPACNTASDCSPGRRCLENACVVLCEDTQCPAGEACLNGKCVERCLTTDGCTDPHKTCTGLDSYNRYLEQRGFGRVTVPVVKKSGIEHTPVEHAGICLDKCDHVMAGAAPGASYYCSVDRGWDLYLSGVLAYGEGDHPRPSTATIAECDQRCRNDPTCGAYNFTPPHECTHFMAPPSELRGTGSLRADVGKFPVTAVRPEHE